MDTEGAAACAGLGASQQMNACEIPKDQLEHAGYISHGAFAPQRRNFTFCALDAAANAGVIAKDQFMLADIFQECILVLLRKQLAAAREVSCLADASGDLLGHALAVAAAAVLADGGSFIAAELRFKRMADIACPTIFLRYICAV